MICIYSEILRDTKSDTLFQRFYFRDSTGNLFFVDVTDEGLPYEPQGFIEKVPKIKIKENPNV